MGKVVSVRGLAIGAYLVAEPVVVWREVCAGELGAGGCVQRVRVREKREERKERKER